MVAEWVFWRFLPKVYRACSMRAGRMRIRHSSELSTQCHTTFYGNGLARSSERIYVNSLHKGHSSKHKHIQTDRKQIIILLGKRGAYRGNRGNAGIHEHVTILLGHAHMSKLINFAILNTCSVNQTSKKG